MERERRVVREIEPLNEEELEKDIRFLFHNRSDTVDQFIEEIVPVIKYHLNEAMVKYQDRLLEDTTRTIKGEIAGIMLRQRRETIYEKKEEVNGW